MERREDQQPETGLVERRGSAPPAVTETQVIAPAQRMPVIVARNQMRRSSDRGFNLATVLALLERRKWVVAGVFTLLMAPLAGYVLTRPPKYEAELKLILKHQGPATGSSSAGVSEAEAAAELELLKSRELYEQTVRQAGLLGSKPATPKDTALAVQKLETSLKVGQVGKTNILSIRYASPNPDLAAAVPNTLAELYLRRHVEVHGNTETAKFFTEQTALFQERLESAQKALAEFRRTGDVSLLQDQKQAYLRRATDLEAAIQEATSGLRDAEQRLAILERQRDQQPASVETGSRVARNSATSEKLKSLLIDLTNKRTELLSKYDPQYRLVKEVDKQIADTRAALERESVPQVVDQTQAPNPLRQSLEAEVLRIQSQMAGLRARRDTLTRDLAEYRTRQSRLEAATASNNDLERNVKIAEENFLLYQRKLEEARLADALDRQRLLSVAILEKAAVPVLAASEHKTYLLLFGFFATLFLALSSAFVWDYLERNLPSRRTAAAAAGPAPDVTVMTDRQAAASVLPEVPRYYQRRPPGSAEPLAPVTVTRQEVNPESGDVTTTTVVLNNTDAWQKLFERRSRTASRRPGGPADTPDTKTGTQG